MRMDGGTIIVTVTVIEQPIEKGGKCEIFLLHIQDWGMPVSKIHARVVTDLPWYEGGWCWSCSTGPFPVRRDRVPVRSRSWPCWNWP